MLNKMKQKNIMKPDIYILLLLYHYSNIGIIFISSINLTKCERWERDEKYRYEANIDSCVTHH